MENLTKQNIINKLYSIIDDLNDSPAYICGSRMKDDAWLYVWYDSLGKDEEKPFVIPGKAPLASLRTMDATKGRHPEKLAYYHSATPVFLECDDDVQRAGEYFAQVLGVVE